MASGAGQVCGRASNSCIGRGQQLCTQLDEVLQGISHDPNYIAGTLGAGAQGWVMGGQTLAYGIHFQNEPTATAPAAKVAVTLPIDANADLASLSLAAINLPGLIVPIGPT